MTDLATILMLLVFASGGVASAAAVQATPDLVSLPWVQIGVGAAIASWGGMTETLGRFRHSEYEARPFRWPVECVCTAAVSVTVGAGAYLGGAWYGLGPMPLGLVLLLSGYLGVRLLGPAAGRLLALITRGSGQ